MSDKTKILYDHNRVKEVYDTSIEVFIEGTDICVFKGKNKVILPGAAFTAAKHWGIEPTILTPNYNTALGIDHTEAVNELDKFIVLFSIGTDGCGPEPSQVYNVNYAKWCPVDALIPFKYCPIANDLDAEDRTKYFGRKVIGDRVAYYFKAFETTPVLVQQYIDGTPIDSNIYASANTTEVETYVETRLKITREDCRQYFTATVGMNEARVNTISLLTAYPVEEADGYTYYKDVKPLTKLNIPVESLIDESKGLDIIYHIYY